MKSTILLIFLFLNSNLCGQYCVPFITMDPDKYTNLREDPDSKSKIVGKVFQYEIFCFIGIECDDDLSNYYGRNWIPVSTDKKSGYIYKKNLLQLDKLPSLKERQTIKHNYDTHGKLVNSNDTLTVIMSIEPFDKNKHNLEITNDHDGEHVWRIDGKDFLGTGYRMPVRKIKMVEIICKDKKTILPDEKIENLYDPHTMQVHIGQTGELYLNISGGGDEGWYSVWFSIVDGNILYECFEDHCW